MTGSTSPATTWSMASSCGAATAPPPERGANSICSRAPGDPGRTICRFSATASTSAPKTRSTAVSSGRSKGVSGAARPERRLKMHRSIASVVVLSLVLGAPGRAASAAVPRLVAELDDSVYDADDLPRSLLPVGGQVEFLNYSSAAEAIILWASDGTTQGTRPLAELSHEYPGARGLGTLNDLAFFAAREDYVSRLWRTDGTIAGT